MLLQILEKGECKHLDKTTWLCLTGYWPWNVATIPQAVTSVVKNNFGPIFLKRRLPTSSAAIYGLDCWAFCIYDIWEDLPEKDSDTGLILFISQVEILLETSNASISCKLTLVLYPSLTPNVCYQYWIDPEDGQLISKAVFLVKENKPWMRWYNTRQWWVRCCSQSFGQLAARVVGHALIMNLWSLEATLASKMLINGVCPLSEYLTVNPEIKREEERMGLEGL